MTSRENRLADETSPYLRQHRFDPVDWFPFGDEALDRAQELDRPLFLSIGYSACHWCHVMAHESFSDPEIAGAMNDSVVAVKIDREERPDLDAVYMESVLAATGQGGWPMSVFATPDGRPFFAGTYFPDRPRHGMPSFRQLLDAVSDAWSSRREEVESQADRLAAAVAGRLGSPPPIIDLGDVIGGERSRRLAPTVVSDAIRRACERLREIADPVHGGFGSAPKFPQPLLVDLLLRSAVAAEGPDQPEPTEDLQVAVTALEAMSSGGIYDQLGGGFHRYSVDREWVVPHFEKMLYDQALLARVYLHAWQITGDERWRQVLAEVLGYVLDRLGQPSGGLAAAEDADSEGEEGRYYVWTRGEIDEAVGPEFSAAAREWFGLAGEPNFEGDRYVLTVARRGEIVRPPSISEARERLLMRRGTRTPPGLDDKVLTEWNAMMAAVLAEAAAATGEKTYQDAAMEIVDRLVWARSDNEGVTPRLVRHDRGRAPAGFAADVAWLLDALVRVFEVTGLSTYLRTASEVAEELVENFVEAETGAVFTTRTGSQPPVVRPVESTDGVVPSGASVTARALARLGTILGDDELLVTAELVVAALSGVISEAPSAVPELLWAAELVAGGTIEVAATGAGRRLLREVVWRRFEPAAVSVWSSDENASDTLPLPLLEGRAGDAVYVCSAGVCRLPAHDGAAVRRELDHVAGRDRT